MITTKKLSDHNAIVRILNVTPQRNLKYKIFTHFKIKKQLMAHRK